MNYQEKVQELRVKLNDAYYSFVHSKNNGSTSEEVEELYVLWCKTADEYNDLYEEWGKALKGTLKF